MFIYLHDTVTVQLNNFIIMYKFEGSMIFQIMGHFNYGTCSLGTIFIYAVQPQHCE